MAPEPDTTAVDASVSTGRESPALPVLRWAAVVVVVVVSLTVLVGIAALGSCDAFGGRCPAEREPLLENDTAGSMAAVGLIGGALVALLAPVRIAWPVRIVAVLAVAVAAGLVGASV